MRVLLVTNIISPHQMPLATKIVEIVGSENFRYVTTNPPSIDRVKLGWNLEETAPWILRTKECQKDKKTFERWWDEADIVISGVRRFRRMQDRLNNKKLTFYMSERWWKPSIGLARLLHPRFALMTAHFVKLSHSPLFHYLPMGGLAAGDMQHIAAFKGRMWTWGYFTAAPQPLPTCERDGGNLRVLWAGRMLGWKRVDTLIKAFAKLQQARSDAELTIVGDGPERSKLEKLAKEMLAIDSFQFMLPMPTVQVIELMKQHHIYVLPSNGYEGWGAVVNEAMSAGCTVIASSVAGSAKTMISHGNNGLLFETGDHEQLANLLIQLNIDEEMRHRLATAGQRTMLDSWTPKIGASRFISVCDALLSHHPVPNYTDGPMAPV